MSFALINKWFMDRYNRQKSSDTFNKLEGALWSMPFHLESLTDNELEALTNLTTSARYVEIMAKLEQRDRAEKTGSVIQ